MRPKRLAIEYRAAAARQTTTNYIRTKLGLPERPPGRPLREQMEREMEEAWDLLREAGHDPTALVPDGDWLDEYRTMDEEEGTIEPPIPPPPGGWR